MDKLLGDVQYAIRGLRRNPILMLIAIVAIAVGVGMTTVVYSIVTSVLVRQLPFANAERLVAVESTLRGDVVTSSYPDATDLARRSGLLESLAVYRTTEVIFTGAAEPEYASALESSASLFKTLGVLPSLGRGFEDRDAHAGATVGVLSHRLWEDRFQADRSILGKTIDVDGQPITIIGVLPRAFSFPLDAGTEEPKIYLPFPRTVDEVNSSRSRSDHSLHIVASAKRGMTVRQVKSELDAVVAQMVREHPSESEDKNLGIRVVSLRDQLAGPIRGTLLLLFVAVGCVLLIACANVAGLLLIRGAARQREIAIRAALGARRASIVGQLMTESALLALVGGVVGGVLALWINDVIVSLVAESLPHVREFKIDGAVLSFTCALTLVSGMAFGCWPALHATRSTHRISLENSPRAGSGGPSRKLRGALLTGEIAVAVVLLGTFALALKSIHSLQSVNPGFRADGLGIAQVVFPSNRYPDDSSCDRYYRTLTTQLASLGGPSAVGGPLPYSDSDISISVSLPGRPPDRRLANAMFIVASPRYFETMGIPVLRGRAFERTDDLSTSAPVLVVSQRFALRLFGDLDAALGKRVQIGLNNIQADIVGVVGDTRDQRLDQRIMPTMYLPAGRAPLSRIGVLGVAVRAASPTLVLRQLRDIVLSTDSNLPPSVLAPMSSRIARTIETQRVLVIVLGAFALIATLLAAVGIYGVISYSVAQRTAELGIRMAVGAKPRQMILLVLSECTRVAAIGIAVGLVITYASSRILSNVVYGASVDSFALILGAVTMFVVSLVSGFLPAWRAARTDVVVALRGF